MLQQNTTVRVDVGPWVGSLAMFCQHLRNDIIDNAHEVDQRVVGHVFEGELALGSVTRVGFAQHGVPETGNDLDE